MEVDKVPQGDLYQWDRQFHLHQAPPYFDDMVGSGDARQDFSGVRALAVLGDSSPPITFRPPATFRETARPGNI